MPQVLAISYQQILEIWILFFSYTLPCLPLCPCTWLIILCPGTSHEYFKIKALIENIGIHNYKSHLIPSCNQYNPACCLKCTTKERGGLPSYQMLPTSSEKAGRLAQAEWLCKHTQTEAKAEEGKHTRTGLENTRSGIPHPSAFPKGRVKRFQRRSENLRELPFAVNYLR